MEILLGWILFSIIVGFIGSGRSIGFAGAFFLSLFLSPLIGLIITFCSADKDQQKYQQQLLQAQKKQAETLQNMQVKQKTGSIADELVQLQRLKETGGLTEAEYQKAKDKALAVINNSKYKLVTERYGVNKDKPGTPFTDMFLDGNSNRDEGNTEALWIMPNEYLSVGFQPNIMRRWWVNRYESISIKVGTKSFTPITYSKEYGGRGLGRFAVTKYALSLYAPGDDRGSEFAWRFSYQMNNAKSLPTGSNPVATCQTPGYTGGTLNDYVILSTDCDEPDPVSTYKQNWPSTRKWDSAPDDPADVQNTSNINDQIYLRLGETYLLLAEAQLGLKDYDGAATTLTTLRARSHASAVVGSQVTIDFILDERSRELITEEPRRYALLRAHKWFDRTKMYNKFSGPLITQRDTLLPIPQSVINANLDKKMDNNGGYN